MALGPKLELRQGQSLVMTPQLQQAIKLLQLSNIELTAYVESELERNPLLERDDDGPVEQAAEGESAVAADAAELRLDDEAGFQAAGDLDAKSEDLYPDQSPADAGIVPSGLDASSFAGIGGRAANRFDDDDFGDASSLSREPTLREHLAEQLMMTPVTPGERLIGVTLIDLVDEAGYLTEDIESVAERLGTDREAVVDVLRRLQGFEPAGVFARSLRECLALQLADHGSLSERMQSLLDNLELVARHDFTGLMRACKVSRDELSGLIAALRRLNPKPGIAFGSEPVQPVIPDVLVRAAPDGSWIVELNSETLPRVLVDQTYYATVSGSARRTEERTYLAECLANANWLVKSLDQRARTVLKVAREIVRQQDAFLVKGVTHLRPLNLRAIADAIEMHESTVSRVTANKFMATPRGIFELKYFFTAAIAATDGGEAVSAEAVRHRIREMIDNESPSEILSDDKLVDLLRTAGIDIARRTVAKYREGMNIPSSVQRRRIKRAYA